MATSAILETLKNKGILSEDQVSEILTLSAEEDMRPLEFLLDDGRIPEKVIFKAIAEETHFPFVDLEDYQVNPMVTSRINGDWARRLKALPLEVNSDGELLVAFERPPRPSILDDLRKLTGANIAVALSAPKILSRKIDTVFRSEAELENLTGAIEDEDNVLESSTLSEDEDLDEIPIVKWVNLTLTQAIADRASDIHIVPTEKEALVRFRIDGVLHNQASSNRNILALVVSRIKVMANMDIAEKRRPQDGRMTLRVGGRKVDLRAVTLPTVYGEKLVLRILDNDTAPTTLEDIGLSGKHQKLYEKFYSKRQGMILVTGPTGSGKSTLLYSTLNEVKSPEIEVISVEDPVELRISGVTQIPINHKAGLGFAEILDYIVRADPDVVMVGEIRNKETAQLAIQAANTGHLVLSTLHTNDAPSAVTRLVEMGIQPFLVGSVLDLVVAQRLLRRLCTKCAAPYTPTWAELELAGFDLPTTEGEPPTLKRAVGCHACSETGYRGRIAIHEILVVDSAIERMISEGSHTDEIRNYAIQNGTLVPMRKDGWEKVYEGITTIEEVLRVSV